MPVDLKEGETLAIRGVLDRTDQFRPRRLTSTTYVRQWPQVESSDLSLELVDREDRVLLRERAQVRPRHGCEPGDAREWNVTAYIALRTDAASVVLRRGDMELWRAAIPSAPRLRVTLASKRVTREHGATLRFTFSPPGEDAFLQVIYQWGERRHLVVAVVPPTDALDVNLVDLPGGKRCRLVVQYSNGLRSAGDATPFFEVPPLGPSVTIVKPSRGTTLLYGQPLELEGQVVDPERPGGPRAAESLAWLVNENVVGRGMIAGVDRLDTGRHRVVLRYEPPGVEPVEAAVTVSVRRGAEGVPPADDWDDSAEWDAIEHRR